MKPSNLLSALQFLVGTGRPCMLWGSPGVGKSDLVSQLAKSLKRELKDVRLARMDPTDLKGFPKISKVGTKEIMSWVPPGFLPTKGKGILFFDEINLAPPAVQAAAYQLVLDRRIDEYVLPEGWDIVAAGNRTTDRSGVHTMSAALANRFVHLDFTVDLDDWVTWAMRNNVSDLTRGYIRYRPSNLTTEKLESGVRAFASPRAWAFADQIVNSKLESHVELEMLSGTIGEGVATEFMGYIRENSKLPSLDAILLNPDKIEVPKSPSTCHALISSLDRHTTPGNFERLMKYIGRMSKEFEVVFVTSVVKYDPDIASSKTFINWSRENRSVLIG